jgi:hypothetical protein
MYGRVDFDEVSITSITTIALPYDSTMSRYSEEVDKKNRRIGQSELGCSCVAKNTESVQCTCLFSRSTIIKLSNDTVYKSYDFKDRYIIHYVRINPLNILIIDNYGTIYELYPGSISEGKYYITKTPYFQYYDKTLSRFVGAAIASDHDAIKSIYSGTELPILCIYKIKQINSDTYNNVLAANTSVSYGSLKAEFIKQYIHCMVNAFPTKQEIKIQYQCINMGPDGYRCKFFINKPDAICKDCQYLLTLAQTLPCCIMKDTDVRCNARSSSGVFGLFICTDCKIHMQSGNPVRICPAFEIKCEGNSECLAHATHIYKIPLCAGHLKRTL